MYLRRRGLAQYFGLSLRTVDYVLAEMYKDGRYDREVIKTKSAVMVRPQAFERALRERKEIRI